MLEEKDIELLEAYTYGKISEADQQKLKVRIAADRGFALAVRRWELTEREGFNYEVGLGVREEVLQLVNDYKPNKKQRPWLLYFLIVLTIAGGFIAWNWSVLTSEDAEHFTKENQVYADLVKTYFRHLPSEDFHLGKVNTLEEKALYAYESREYATALPLLLELVASGGDSLNLLYAGVAALGMGDGNEALLLLQQVPSSRHEKKIAEEVFFYQILACVEKGDIAQARLLIESNPDSSLWESIGEIELLLKD